MVLPRKKVHCTSACVLPTTENHMFTPRLNTWQVPLKHPNTSHASPDRNAANTHTPLFFLPLSHLIKCMHPSCWWHGSCAAVSCYVLAQPCLLSFAERGVGNTQAANPTSPTDYRFVNVSSIQKIKHFPNTSKLIRGRGHGTGTVTASQEDESGKKHIWHK